MILVTTRPLRVGVIGASAKRGWARNTHVPALLALPDYELAAVCTSHKDTAESSAKHFGVLESYHDHRLMLENADLDVVAVSVRVPFHYRLTMDALNAGKHVYTEWPLGSNLDEAIEMAELARVKNVSTMIGLQARVSPVFLRARELIDQGYVGKILSSRLTLINPGILSRTSTDIWQNDRSTGVNTFTISFAHPIDALCMCLGEFKEVSAILSTQVKKWQATDTGKEVDVNSPDNVMISGILESGAAVSVHVATIPWNGSGYQFEIYGTEGTLVLDSPAHAQMGGVNIRGSDSEKRKLEVIEVPDGLSSLPDSVRSGVVSNVAHMWKKFANNICDGVPVETDFELAVRLHRFLNVIERASDTGMRQTL